MPTIRIHHVIFKPENDQPYYLKGTNVFVLKPERINHVKIFSK